MVFKQNFQQKYKNKYKFICKIKALQILISYAQSLLESKHPRATTFRRIFLIQRYLQKVHFKFSRGCLVKPATHIIKFEGCKPRLKRKFIITRHTIKKLGQRGLIPYLKRGSW